LKKSLGKKMPIHSTQLLSSSGIWLDIDLSFVIILSMIFLLMAILNKLIFNPFLSDMDERDSKTTKTREEAVSLKHKANELKNQYQSLNQEVLNQAYDARKELRVAGLKSKEAQVADAKASATDSLAQAQKELEAQFDQARTQALTQVEAIAQEIAKKLLGRAV
jgi:F-type H+-transporting ATPase subunit b